MVVPTMLARIVEYLDNDSSVKITSLRALSYGGGKMPRNSLLSALTLLPDTNLNAYGLLKQVLPSQFSGLTITGKLFRVQMSE